MVGLVAWGTAAMRTQGDDVAEVLALLGVRPTWHPESRRVTGIEVVPLAELGRPRIDVTVRISGFFRDAFPHLVRLLDDAVAAVAALDEPDEDNYVAAHARADAERLAAEIGADGAWRRATTRDLRLQARAPTAPGSCSCSTRATGATTTTSPRSTRPGAATPTAAAWTARRRRTRCATASRASRSRSRTSTSASTTSSTPTTTTSTTAA